LLNRQRRNVLELSRKWLYDGDKRGDTMENHEAILKKLEPLRAHFPIFHAKLCSDAEKLVDFYGKEYILPPASANEIATTESQLGLLLPKSYKQFLRCLSGFMGPIRLNRTPTTFNQGHPFVVDVVYLKGTICVAEYFLEADGDQIYLDARQGLISDEYPVLYYAHDFAPESRYLRKLADSFGEWLESF
jgi:hypothetical protein